METTLISGGAGFIGSHLVDHFIERNHKVIVIDSLYTGKTINLTTHIGKPNFLFIKKDISLMNSTYRFSSGKIDNVLHFASPASPIHYQKLAFVTMRANSIGTEFMLDVAREHNARFVLASTSEIYGDPLEHPQKETYYGNVNSVGPRACFSPDTEILTDSGWKFFPEICDEDNFATLSPINHKLEYYKANEIIKQKYEGDLIHFEGERIDFLVTPNHKMYFRKGKGPFTFIEANSNISWRFLHAKTDCLPWEGGKETEFFFLPKVENRFENHYIEKIDMDLWLEFFGYYLSEGCIYKRKKGPCLILIAQDKIKNPDKWEKINNCLKKMPFRSNYSNHQWFITNKQLYYYLTQFGKSGDRFIPKEIKNLSARQLRILIDSLYLGDGCTGGHDYSTSSKKLADDFQEICLKIGWSGKINISHANKKRNILYHVYIRGMNVNLEKKYKNIKALFEPRLLTTPKKIPYEGDVYCINVPNHIIYVRRKGNSAWCGNCYDESKRYAEALVSEYNRKFNLKGKIIRIFNTYGSRMDKDDGRAVPEFIKKALKNEPIVVFGDGSQTRSLCYIDDMVGAIDAVLYHPDELIVNAGNDKEITVLDLALTIKELCNSSSEIVFADLPENDPLRRCPCLDKIKEERGWFPTTDLVTGLQLTIDWFKGQL